MNSIALGALGGCPRTLESTVPTGKKRGSALRAEVGSGPAVLGTFGGQVGPEPAVLGAFARQDGPGVAVLRTFELQVGR